jgi:SOS-response transcriptional repressor LexA
MGKAMKLETLGERMKWLRLQKRMPDGHRVTLQEFGKLIGASKGTISHWENGNVSDPQSERFTKACKFLGGNPQWIMTGKGEPFAVKQNVTNITEMMANTVMIPILNPDEVWDYVQHLKLGRKVEMRTCPKSCSDSTFALKVTGDDMVSVMPSASNLLPGSVIYIDPEVKPPTGSIALAILKSGEEVVRKLVKDGDDLYLMPLNNLYSRIKVTDGVKLIGKVICVVNEL